MGRRELHGGVVDQLIFVGFVIAFQKCVYHQSTTQIDKIAVDDFLCI